MPQKLAGASGGKFLQCPSWEGVPAVATKDACRERGQSGADRNLHAFASAHCALVLSTRQKGDTKPVATLKCEICNDAHNDLDRERPELRTDAHKKSSTSCTVSTGRTNVDQAYLVRNTTTQTPRSDDFVPVVFALSRGRFGS